MYDRALEPQGQGCVLLVLVGRRGVSHVQFGDLIVMAGGIQIDDPNDWYSFLESKRPGDRVTLRVVRQVQNPRRRLHLTD